MQKSRFTVGSRVLVQPTKEDEPKFGLVMEGPMLFSGDPFFKVRTDYDDAWYPLEHLSPYLKVVKGQPEQD